MGARIIAPNGSQDYSAEDAPPKVEIKPMVLFHDVLDDEYCLRRTVGDKTDHLDIEDYDEKDGSFTRMTRYFQNGDNPDAELILRPLVELGGLTIVSEYDDRSPYAQAQKQALTNGVEAEFDKDAVEAGLKRQTEEMQNLMNETDDQRRKRNSLKEDHNGLKFSTKEERIKAGIKPSVA